MKLTALCMVLCVAVLLAGCPGAKPSAGGSGKASSIVTAQPEVQAGEHPIPLSERSYTKVHKSVEDAWYLVETGYTVIKDKYTQANLLLKADSPDERSRGAAIKDSIKEELQRTVFTINPTIDNLFKEAIAAEPDNPLNYAAYSYYLKARKRVDETGKYLGEGEQEARRNIDKAIELWPDDADFYLLKIHILSAPHQCHEWYRGMAGEDIVLANRLTELRKLFESAEKYDPQNAYVNYYHALLFTSLTPPNERVNIRDEVLREIVAGNSKPIGKFFFPPPLDPYYDDASIVKFVGTEEKAIYYDQWNFFGIINETDVRQVVDLVMGGLEWPRDKETVGQLMLAIYKFGTIKPLTRSFFALQSGIITNFQMSEGLSNEDASKLAIVARFLNQQYFELANEMLAEHVLLDSKQMDVSGVGIAENRVFRRLPDITKFQKRQAAYLLKVEDTLGLDLQMPTNAKEW